MANDKNGVALSYEISDREVSHLAQLAMEAGQATGPSGAPRGFEIAVRVGLQLAFEAGRKFERIKVAGETATKETGGW